MKRFAIYSLLVLMHIFVYAQQEDAVLLGGINIEKKFDKKTSFTLFNQYAFNENYSELAYFLFDGGLTYRLTRNISFGVNYRFSEIRNLQNFYQDRQTIYGDISYSKGIDDFSIALRTRYQVNYYGLSLQETENYKSNKHFLRNKATLRYKLNPDNTIFVSCEQLYRFDLKDKTDAWRTGAGISHQFNLHHRIELSYSVYQKVNTKSPDTDYVTSLMYYFRF